MSKKTPAKLAVFGSPIQHSLSPDIHQMFAEQFDVTLSYQRIEANQDSFIGLLDKFRAQGGIGANITTPLKINAQAVCHSISSRAKQAGAINTLKWDLSEQAWIGDNTDGQGFVSFAEKSLLFSLENAKILLLGAGGAGKAVAYSLLQEPIASLTVLNRDMAKLEALKENARVQCMRYEAFNDLPNSQPIDMIINATASSLYQKQVPLESKFLADKIVIDLTYSRDRSTLFMDWARRHGARRVVDGLGMLVEQAALSFKNWFGLMPDTKPVYDYLNERVS